MFGHRENVLRIYKYIRDFSATTRNQQSENLRANKKISKSKTIRREGSRGWTRTSDLDLATGADGEDDVGVGVVINQLKHSRGGGWDPVTNRPSIPDLHRQRDEIWTRGGERRIAEEARELDLPPLSDGAQSRSHRLLHRIAWYQSQSARHFFVFRLCASLYFGQTKRIWNPRIWNEFILTPSQRERCGSCDWLWLTVAYLSLDRVATSPTLSRNSWFFFLTSK